MSRILILGCPGAGKSTLARDVADRLNLPLVHLDSLWWEPGWVEAGSEVMQARISAHLDQDAWVMDGNYTRHGFEARLERADMVIWLDFPTWLCLWRVTLRAVILRGQTRSDMGAGCPEKLDMPFLQFVAGWNRRNRPKLEALFKSRRGTTSYLRLNTPQQVRQFTGTLKQPRQATSIGNH